MTEYRFLSFQKQKDLLQSRFGISVKKHHKVSNDKLNILQCENLYEALSYAYTGSVRHSEAFREEILYFLRESWINPVLLESFEKELLKDSNCKSLESYVEGQLTNFHSSPSLPLLEVRAAATFLQVTIHVYVPDESKIEPKFTFRPIVKDLRKSLSDPCTYDEKDSIVISATRNIQDRYVFGAVVSFPYDLHHKPKQISNSNNDQSANMFIFLKNFFVKNTSQSKAAEICDNIGYPKLKYYGKRRPGVSHSETLEKVFTEWYPVAESFCKRIGIKPSTLLARSYLMNDEMDLCKTLEPSENRQLMREEADFFRKAGLVIQRHFMKYVKPTN